MMKPDRAWLGRAVVALGVLCLAMMLAISAYAAVIADGGGPYQTADWLISYAGGFVRRGLFGSIYLALFPPGQAGLWVLFGLQVLLYVIPIGYTIRWLAHSRFSWAPIALACGPAAWAFSGWDVLGFARKESLGLSALTLLAIASAPGRRGGTRHALTVGALVMFALAVFSWEGNALLVPGVDFLLLAAWGGWRASRRGRVYALVAVGLAVGGLASSGAFSGTSATGDAVCAALQAKGLDSSLCGGPFGGAIGYLGKTPAQMVDVVGQSFPLYWGYLPGLLLGLLPILSTTWVRQHRRLVLASVVALAPLFVVAADYGRWIALLVLELLICLMATERTPTSAISWTGFTTVLYLTMWGIPHWTASWMEPPWPWLGAVKELTTFLIDKGPHG